MEQTALSAQTLLTHPLDDLVRLGQQKTFARKNTLIREGESGNTLFVLIEGRVRIFAEGPDGRRFVFGNFGPGTLFGECSLDNGPRTASVEAMTECVCAEVPYAEMRRRMAADPGFAMTLLTELITRSRASTQRLKSLALDPVYLRLRALIESEAVADERGRRLGPDWSQQEIANRLGSSRDMVTRIFRELTKGGYIATGRGETRILKALPKAW